MKKAYRKKAAQYRNRKTHSQTRTRSKSRSPDKVEQTQNSNIAKFINDLREFESPDNSSVEDIGLYDMPPEFDNKMLDELVFQGDTDRRMNIERCRRLREFCTLYPRTCALDEKFKRNYVEPCQRYNIQDVKNRKNQAYDSIMDYKKSIPERLAYNPEEIIYDRVPAKKYISTMNRTIHNPSGSVFKRYGHEALVKALTNQVPSYSYGKVKTIFWTPNATTIINV